MKIGDILNFKTGQVQIYAVHHNHFSASIMANSSPYRGFFVGSGWQFNSDGKFSRYNLEHEHELDLDMNSINNIILCSCELCKVPNG